MKYGYARVSTDDQSVALQRDALERAGCTEIFADNGVSGVATRRPQLDKLLKTVRAGDQIIVWRLDRLGRSLRHLVETINELREREIGFVSLTESIDTTSPTGELIFHLFAALAHFERRLISQRTQAGMAAARKRGTHVGRPRKLSTAHIEHAQQLLDEGKSKREVAHLLKVSPTTLYERVIRGNGPGKSS